jgi:hypothetical protein
MTLNVDLAAHIGCIVESSPPATSEIESLGREIEFRQGGAFLK